MQAQFVLKLRARERERERGENLSIIIPHVHIHKARSATRSLPASVENVLAAVVLQRIQSSYIYGLEGRKSATVLCGAAARRGGSRGRNNQLYEYIRVRSSTYYI